MSLPRLALVTSIVTASATAVAQPAAPAPTMPTDPYADDAPAADAAAAPADVGAAGADGSAAAPAAEPWDPLDDDGWPRGVSLETLRALRPCGLTEQLPGPGEVIPCRPEVIAEVPQWWLATDWTTGVVAADLPVTGGAHALGVELGFGVSRADSLGVRYELMGVGLPSTPDDMLAIGRSQRFLAMARHRFFTDEVGRDAWEVGVGGGWAVQEAELGGGAPIVRASLGRDVGMYLDDENAVTAGLELAYERNLDDSHLSAVVAAARFGFEVNIRAPRNLGTVAPAPRPYLSAGADIYLGPFLGLGYSVGVMGRHLGLIGTTSFMFGLTDGGAEHGLDGSQWAAQLGPRISAGWPARAPLYLQAQVGPMWVSHEPSREVTVAGDLELGLMPFASCDGRIDLGIRLRADVADGVDVLSGAMVLRLSLGGGAPRGGGGCGRGDGRVAYMPSPPPPPAPPPPPDAGTVTTTAVGGGAALDGGATVDGGAAVDVVVEPPKPIEVEVELGASWLGGAVEIRIDPRLVPLDRLRSGGLVEVELSGPEDALARYEASLRGLLDREGVRVDAWSRLAGGGAVVRARFTIYPPGSR